MVFPAVDGTLTVASNVLAVARHTTPGMRMTDRQFCADKLLLVREMLEAAGAYLKDALNACHAMSEEHEDRTMLRVAYDHVLDLRDRVRVLDKRVNEVEAHLRVRLGGTHRGAAKKSKAARAGDSPRG
jgi:hypothetical protein